MTTSKQKKSNGEDEPEGWKQAERHLRIERERLVSELAADLTPSEEVINGWEERDSAAEGGIRELEYVHRGAIRQRIIRIDRSLERINEGTYGLCNACGEGIERRRLSHEPDVEFCLSFHIVSDHESSPSTM